MMKKVLAAVIILIMMPTTTLAAIINVPGDQPTIQAGVDVATNGDTIQLADGLYVGPGNYNVSFRNKSLTLKSLSGNPDNCIIDCQQKGFALKLVYPNQTITVNGLTIKHGKASYTSMSFPTEGGSGIICKEGSLIVTNCKFERNQGMAIVCDRATITLTSCQFISNVDAKEDTSGAAIFALYSTVSIGNCLFSGNQVSDEGGAIEFNNSAFEVENCNFFCNHATAGGGAIYITFQNQLPITYSAFKNCKFISNYSHRGGAIEICCSNVTDFLFSNCIFASNAAREGGAVRIDSGSESGSELFTNCTFTSNQASDRGGALYCTISSTRNHQININNCILWGDNAPHGPEIGISGKAPIVNWSNIQGGYAGNGNIDADPLFVNAASHDLHLQGGSPCIDVGTSNEAPPIDLDDNPRPSGPGIDLGAYEYQPTQNNENPVVYNFIATPNGGEAPLRVTFVCYAFDPDGGEIVEYRWDFNGDGVWDTTTTTPTTEYLYRNIGNYTAVCAVVDDENKLTQSHTLPIEILPITPLSEDGDGVPSWAEDNVPNNGDGNGDGILDRYQSYVTSLPTINGRGYVTLVSYWTCSQNLEVTALQESPEDPDYNYPYGLIHFKFPSSSAEFEILFHGNVDLHDAKYRQYGPVPPDFSSPRWYTLSPNIIFTTHPFFPFPPTEPDPHYYPYSSSIYPLNDGEIGDDTGADGMIVCTAGPALENTIPPVDDNDGIPSSVEDGAPNNGDGNGDGILDSIQPNVTSLPAASGQGYITLVTNSPCSQNLEVQALQESPDDPNYDFPFGLVSFKLHCYSADIRIYFHGDNNPDIGQLQYRKYGPTPPDFNLETWYRLDNANIGTKTIGTHDVLYAEFSLLDGAIGDDTETDGIIIDQGGLAIRNGNIPTLNQWGAILLVMLICLVAWHKKELLIKNN